MNEASSKASGDKEDDESFFDYDDWKLDEDVEEINNKDEQYRLHYSISQSAREIVLPMIKQESERSQLGLMPRTELEILFECEQWAIAIAKKTCSKADDILIEFVTAEDEKVKKRELEAEQRKVTATGKALKPKKDQDRHQNFKPIAKRTKKEKEFSEADRIRKAREKAFQKARDTDNSFINNLVNDGKNLVKGATEGATKLFG